MEYRFPSLDLLDEYPQEKHLATDEEVTRNCDEICSFLSQSRIEKAEIKVAKGPVASMYKITLKNADARTTETIAEDLRWSRVGASARVTASKGGINMEIPNRNPSKISLKDIIGSEDFLYNDYELPVAAGVDIAGKARVIDLATAKHILIGGSTGQGKTTFLHTVIASLLYAKRPDELKFVLIDPKMVEFNAYAKLAESYLAMLQPNMPHPIITDAKEGETILLALLKEMNNRYELMDKAAAADIKSYNNKFMSGDLKEADGHRRLPYIVVIIDEYSDYIYHNDRNIMTSIMNLAQKGCDAGIHLIMASKMPESYAINRLVQSGFATRIAFRVVIQVDSRAIIGTNGAEMLVGNGDMLYKSGQSVERLHGAFISDPEISRIVDYVSSGGIHSRYMLAPETIMPETIMPAKQMIKRDPMFDEAAKLVAKKKFCNPALLQNGLAVGYNRACNIIEQLEDARIVNADTPRRKEKPVAKSAGCQNHRRLPRRRYIVSQLKNENSGTDITEAQHIAPE